MPVEQNPAKYYHIYVASQKRVERWVQETSQQLQEAALAGQDSLKPEQGPIQALEPESRPRASRRSSSSKHRTNESRSRSRPSSASKKIKVDKTAAAGIPHHNGARGQAHSHTSRDPSLSTYLPYGILPLLLAVTGTSALSVILAIVLLVGYTFNMPIEEPRSSKKSRHS